MSSPKMLNLCLNLTLLILMAGCAGPQVNKNADQYFKEGEEFYADKHYEDAIAQWKKVKESYSSFELSTKAELKIADAQFESDKYIEAAASYEDFRKLHPSHEKAPYALYRLGLCHFKQITGIDTDQAPVKNATANFQTFLRLHPASEHAAEVREKLEICETKMFQYEVYVGRFYLRTDKHQSAIQRLQDALARYPKNQSRDEALFYLGQAYLLSGERTKGRDTFLQLTNEYVSSPFVEKAKKFMENNY